MIGFIIVVVIFAVFVFIGLKFEEGNLVGGAFMVLIIGVLIDIIVINVNNNTSKHYKNKLYDKVQYFEQFPVKFKIEFIEQAKEYEEWRLENIDEYMNSWLYSAYYCDDAQKAPRINIDSLIHSMEKE